MGKIYSVFENRFSAGEKLSALLHRFTGDQTYILALPRGGVEVASTISYNLHIPMDVIVSRKIAVPSQPEFAIGAISEFDTTCINTTMTKHLRLDQKDIEALIRKEKKELQRRVKLYRNNKTLSYIRDKTVLVVDDGIATGLTAQAALQAIRMLHPKQIIFACPVCASESLPRIQKYADQVISLITPKNLRAVGNYYQNFEQIDDNQVIKLLSSTDSLPNHPHYSSHSSV